MNTCLGYNLINLNIEKNRFAELRRCIGQTPQNFNKKLKHGTVSFDEMVKIAEAVGVGYEQASVLPDGNERKMGI